MFNLNDNFNYYLYPSYIAMGKGIEGLHSILCSQSQCNPLSGDVFLFFSKKKDTVKLLRWDTDGFILYQKRLEAGTFELPRFQPDKGLCKLPWETVYLIMRGIPLRSFGLRKRFKI